MCTWQVDLLHMARDASITTQRTSRRRPCTRLLLVVFGPMTSSAFRVIETLIVFQAIVRVMTCDTADSWISFVSRTVKDPIGLVADVVDTVLAGQVQDLFETAMTSTTEFLREFVAIQLCGREDLQIDYVVSLHGCNVFISRSVARLAANPGNQMSGLQTPVPNRPRRMATETSLGRVFTERPTQRVYERQRNGMRMKNSEVEIPCLAIITDSAFVERAIVFQDECLTQLTLAKAKKDRRRQFLPPIGNNIRSLRAGARESIHIGSICETEIRLCFEARTVVARFGRACHRVRRLHGRFVFVTLHTNLIANVASS